MIKNFLLLVLCISILGCQEYTKEQYLQDYKNFVEEIKSQHSTYEDDSWKQADAKNGQFYGSDYKRFAGELKPSEYLKVQRYNFVYNYYRGEISLKSLMKGEYNEIFKGIGKEATEIAKELAGMLQSLNKESKLGIINKLLN